MKKILIIIFAFIGVAAFQNAQAAGGDGATSNIKLLDTNLNGFIDQITFDINNPNLESWRTQGSAPYGLGVTQDGTAMAILQVNVDSSSSNPAKVRITLAESGILSTDGVVDHPIELTYAPSGGIGSGSNINDGVDELLNQINAGDNTSADREIDSAKPLLRRSGFRDINNDGRIETITTYWSEDVMMQGASSSDWILTRGSLTALFVAAFYDPTPGESLDIGITANINQTSSGVLPTIKYVGNRPVVFDQSNNPGLESAVINVSDEAPPVIIKALPGDNYGDGTTDFLAITFSEQTVLGGDRSGDYFTISFNGINRTIDRDSYQSPAEQIRFYFDDAPVNNLGAIYAIRYKRDHLGFIKDLSGNEMIDQYSKQSLAPEILQGTDVILPGLNALQTGFLELKFTTNLKLPANFKMKLNLISGFTYLAPVSVYCPAILGYFNTSVDKSILTMSRTHFNDLDAGTFQCTISSVQNPSLPGTYGPYILEMSTNDDVVLSYQSFIVGDKIVGDTTAVVPPTTIIIVEPPTTEQPIALGLPSGGEYINPENKSEILSRLNVAEDLVCEQQYLPLIKNDAAVFLATLSVSQENSALTFVCYAISQETQKLGSGERRALLRDYFQTLFRDQIYWDDVATNVLARKPIHRNLTKEQAQVGTVLSVFRRIYGHDPVFSITDEDLAWNTLMYRIRFPRDLTVEREGILRFVSLYGRNPSTPLDWAAVRVLAYIKK